MARLFLWLAAFLPASAWAGAAAGAFVDLPKPRADGGLSVERALQQRRAVRDFRPAPLTLAQAAQLLWSAQGITGADGRRTAPSAGALYPLQAYVAASNVAGLPPGIEVGHAAQNVFLQAQALGLSAAAVGAFDESQVAARLGMSDVERPLYLMPVGEKAVSPQASSEPSGHR